jgi:tetratricopeptide (TPR) repeat protein
VLPHLPDTRERVALEVDVRVELQITLRTIGKLSQLLDHSNAARNLAESLGDRRRLGLVWAHMAWAFFVHGQHEQAVDAGRQALAISTSESDRGVQVDSRFRLGQAYHALGEYEQAIQVLRDNTSQLDRGLAQERHGLERLGLYYLPFLTVSSGTWLVYCLAEQGEFAEAFARAREGVAIGERVSHPYTRIIALHGLAFTHLLCGDHREAIPLLERGLALCRESDLSLWYPDYVFALGYGCALAGRAGAALPPMEQSLREQKSIGQQGQLPFWMTSLGEVYLHAQRHDEARRVAYRALTLARERNQHGVRALCHRLEAEVAMHTAPFDPDAVERQYREALALATERSMRPEVAHCHLGLAKLYRRTGKREQAQEHLTTATTMYREMGMTYWLEKAEAEMGSLA